MDLETFLIQNQATAWVNTHGLWVQVYVGTGTGNDSPTCDL